MGLFDFIKTAGESLRFDEGGPSKAALTEQLKSHGLAGNDLSVEVKGEKVILHGKAPSQEVLDKAVLAVGNVAGVAQVETAVETPDPKDPLLYRVKDGDTLWQIAEEHFGDGSRFQEIVDANKPLIQDPDEIYRDQTLRLPQL